MLVQITPQCCIMKKIPEADLFQYLWKRAHSEGQFPKISHNFLETVRYQILTRCVSCTGVVRCVAIHPAGGHVISGGGDQTIRFWALPPELSTSVSPSPCHIIMNYGCYTLCYFYIIIVCVCICVFPSFFFMFCPSNSFFLLPLFQILKILH